MAEAMGRGKAARYRPSNIITAGTARFGGGWKPGFGPEGIGRKGLPIPVGWLPGQTYWPRAAQIVVYPRSV